MLLKVSLSDGQTLTFNLLTEGEVWAERESDPAFQASVRGLTLIHNGVLHSLPHPRFGRTQFRAEVVSDGDKAVAARAGYIADDVMVWMTIYFNGSPPMVRMDVKRVGKPRWMPDRRDRWRT